MESSATGLAPCPALTAETPSVDSIRPGTRGEPGFAAFVDHQGTKGTKARQAAAWRSAGDWVGRLGGVLGQASRPCEGSVKHGAGGDVLSDVPCLHRFGASMRTREGVPFTKSRCSRDESCVGPQACLPRKRRCKHGTPSSLNERQLPPTPDRVGSPGVRNTGDAQHPPFSTAHQMRKLRVCRM